MKKNIIIPFALTISIIGIALYSGRVSDEVADPRNHAKQNRPAAAPLEGVAADPSVISEELPHEPITPTILQSLLGDETMPEEFESHILPYRHLRGEPEHFSSTQERPLLRRVHVLHLPAFKYPEVRVDQIFSVTKTGVEEVHYESAMVASHVISSLPINDGEALPDQATRLGNSHLVRIPADTEIQNGSDPLAARIAGLEQQGIFAEPDFLVFPTTTPTKIPNDPSYSQLWGMSAIGAPQAWHMFTGEQEVVVGVIDTGIDANHPDLAGNLWQNPGESGAGSNNSIDDDGNGFIDDVRGWNFYSDNNNPQDLNGHGTHCAGTIGARGDNSLGVAGVTWKTRLVSIKFLGPQGGATSDAIRAVDYATGLGISITNNSWGGGGYSTLLKESIDRAGAAGMLFVAAAGNNGRNTDSAPSFPAAYDSPNILSVAALQSDLRLADFSNYGARSVDIAAPGRAILSTVPGGYQIYNGTSMAAPHVAGAAVLLKGRFPSSSAQEIRQLILDHAAPRPELSGKCQTGGMLSLHQVFDGTPPGDPTHPPVDPPMPVAATLARGSDHFLRLNADGTVLQWGNNQPTPGVVPGLSEVTQVAAGADGLSFALRRDGTVVRWNGTSVAAPILGLTNIVEISAGSTQLIARRQDGTVWSHGSSYIGQGLGDGLTTSTSGAVQVQGIQDAASLAAGHSHNLVLRATGTLVSWGYNHSGQLGDNTTQNRTTPVPVAHLTNVRSLAVGKGTLLIGNGGQFYILGNQNLVVKTDGTVWSWGHNRYGELGYNSSSEGQHTPRQIPGLTDIRSVAAGQWNSYAIDHQGTLLAWGWNGYGQLGLGHNHTQRTPAPVPGITGATQVAAGGLTAGALLDDGSVWAWGSASGGSLGNGIVPELTFRPVDPGLSDIVSIGAGYDGSAFVTQSGRVWATGSSLNYDEFYNPFLTGASTLNSPARSSYAGVKTAPGRINNVEYELLANGNVRFAGSSSLVPNLSNIRSIDAWGWAGAAIHNDGSLWTWGQSGYGNAQGQLGDGTTVSRPDARRITGLANVVSVSVADYHMLAADASGRVFAWGSGSYGKLGNGTSTSHSSPIHVPGLSGVVQVAAGGSHSLALTSSGILYTWGFSGTCGHGLARTTPAILNLPEPIIHIAAGISHSLAVTTSGKIYSWGGNNDCQLGNGTSNTSPTPVEVSLITNAVQVSAGKNHSIALLADGTVRLWGSNSVGQIGDGNSRSERPVLVLAPGGLARSATLSFAASSQLNWFASHFSEAELKLPSVSGDLADPDSDGLSNLVEYALGTNPRMADSSTAHIRWSIDPVDSVIGIDPSAADPTSPRHLTCFITRQAIRPDVNVTVQFSDNLRDWSGEAESATENISSDPLHLRFRSTFSTKEKPSLFGRVIVNRIRE